MTVLAADLAKALGATKSGAGWKVRCPAHDDRDPSLSIREGDNGAALITCHAGCERADIIDELKARGHWNSAMNGAEEVRRPAGPAPIVPVPRDAPPCDWRHPRHGRPSASWEYHTAAGEVHHVRARFDFRTDDGAAAKEVLPIAWCRMPNGSHAWASKEPRGHLPLYGLVDLLDRPNAPVLVVEGEKAADAAAKKLPGYVSTTSAGGGRASHKTDWTPLAARRVVIWPDADEPGNDYANAVAKHCRAAAASSVAIVTLPTGLPKGWDIADDTPSGLDIDAAALASTARPPDAATNFIRATPFVWRDPASIPPRRWLYARHYIRKFVSATIAPGGLGKSALLIAEALAMTTGRGLLGHEVAAPLRVWLWNGEDPREELERRIAAACVYFGITPDDIGDRLFLDSGREMGICIAKLDHGDVRIAEGDVEQVKQTIKSNRIDVLQLDPFVETHQVGESDNGAINRVARQWQHTADATDSSIELVHHSRKPASGNNGVITVDDSRGASALVSAVRSARVLNPMTADEGARTKVDNHRLYFRIDNGKRNLAPPSDAATWCKLASVELANGDNVGVVTPWAWPDAFDDITPAHTLAVQKRVAGGRWRASSQAEAWVGKAIADVLGLDHEDAAAKAKIKALIKTWIKNRVLKVEMSKDEHREERSMVVVGEWQSG